VASARARQLRAQNQTSPAEFLALLLLSSTLSSADSLNLWHLDVGTSAHHFASRHSFILLFFHHSSHPTTSMRAHASLGPLVGLTWLASAAVVPRK